MGLSVSPACVTWGGARPRGRLVLPRPLGRAPPHVTQAGLTLRSDVWSLTDIYRDDYNLKQGRVSVLISDLVSVSVSVSV